jgi:alpha-methylacyl-CoA racemase
MTDGVISLLGMIYGDLADGRWVDARASNPIDGAAPFYDVYACGDGRWLSVAAIEPQFYASLWRALEQAGTRLPAPLAQLLAQQWQRETWPALKLVLTAAFASRSRDEWGELFAPHDACVAPVLSLAEAQRHPHNIARRSFIEIAGILQPAVAPRMGGIGSVPAPPNRDAIDIAQALSRWR